MKDIRKFIGAGLLVLIAMVLTFKLKAALGWSPDLILPVLAVTGFLLNIYPLTLLVFLSAWVLNWQTGLPAEIWILSATPFFAWLGKRFLPSMPWLTLAATIVVGEILLYAVADTNMFFSNIGFIISNIAFASFLGVALAVLLEWVYEER